MAFLRSASLTAKTQQALGLIANCRLPKECSKWKTLLDTALEKRRAKLDNCSKVAVTDAAKMQQAAYAQSNNGNGVGEAKDGPVEACWQSPADHQTGGDAVIAVDPASSTGN
jgi:hypothetical protein